MKLSKQTRNMARNCSCGQFSFSAATFLLLASTGVRVASANLQRKRFAVKTDAQQPKDLFSMERPFGAERELNGIMIFDSMSMCMSMCMSMSMDIKIDMDPMLPSVPKPNKGSESDTITVATDESTNIDPNAPSAADNIQNSIVDTAGVPDTSITDSTRTGGSDGIAQNINTPDTEQQTDYTSVTERPDKNVEAANPSIQVPMNTDVPNGSDNLSVPRTGSTGIRGSPGGEGGEEEDSEESTNVSVSSKSTGQSEEIIASNMNSAATGAVVAGALAALFGGVTLAYKRKRARAASSSVGYFGEDVTDIRDLA